MSLNGSNQVLNIALDELVPDPYQPRKTFLNEELQRLADSIRARGLLQPIRVRRDQQRGCWVIVLGESRWRASKLAGLTHIPALPMEGEPNEADVLCDQIVENTARNAIRPLELARAFTKVKALKAYTSQELAKELGISGGTISKCEALLTLPLEIQTLVDEGRVPESAAYEISRIPDPQGQLELAAAVAADQMNRAKVADAVRGRIGKKNVRPKAGRLSCKHEGISFSLSSGQPLEWDSILSTLDHIRKQAKKLADEGKEVSALARVMRAS